MSKSAADRYTKRYEHYDMEFLGYKTNMTNIQAALLLHQVDRIEKNLAKKERISRAYTAAFQNEPALHIPAVLPHTKHARHIYTVWVDPEKRDSVLHTLQDKGVGVAVNFRPIHLMSYYRKKYGYKTGDFPIAEKIGTSTITIPLYPKLTPGEVKYVVDTILACVK